MRDVGLAGVVGALVAGAVRVSDDNLQVRNVEGEVVVAAIPQDDVDFFFGGAQDFLVIDTGIDDHAVIDVRFVLFALFDGAFVLVQVVVVREALYFLATRLP
jgi:hypothetical protein